MKPVSTWYNKVDYYKVDEDDKEVKIIKINSVQIESNILSLLESNEESNGICDAVY